MQIITIAVLAAVILILVAYILVLRNKLKQTAKNLKELIKENDGQQSNPVKTTSEIYFKVDQDFKITFINETGADILGYLNTELIGQSVFGTLLEDKNANREMMANVLSKMCRNQSSINTQIVLLKKDGQKQLMLCRERPLLNEVLDCEGISLLCKDISEAKAWEENLTHFHNRDIFTTGLNETALTERFEHDFQLAKRYNKPFAVIMAELKDVYEFISHGIDFETADKLLKVVSDICYAHLTPNANIGRAEKTKIVMVLNNTSSETAGKIAAKIYQETIPAIRKLGIDEYNAAMMVIGFGEKRNFNDSADAMWTRMRRRIKAALRQRYYGVLDTDKREDNNPVADGE